MSNSNSNNSSNNSFSHAFLPGLILGLIVGSVAGAFLPDFLGGSKLASFEGSPGNANAVHDDRDERGSTAEFNAETQKLIDDALNNADEVVDDLEEEGSDAMPEITPPGDG